MQCDRVKPKINPFAGRPFVMIDLSKLRSQLHVTLDHLTLVIAATLCALISGCASFTNPVANGVPVRLLPDELLARSKEGYQTIPLTMLRQPPPEHYLLAAGDTLGIFIEGVLGEAESPPPVNIPDSAELPPSIGYPIPLRADGTISLPYVEPIKVAGLTIEQAEQAVVDAYLKKQIVRAEDRRILVTLMRPRYVKVLVIRDDSQERQFSLQTQSLQGLGSSTSSIGGGPSGQGMVLELPAYENDVLNVLTRSGGLPGLESTQEVIIQRGFWDERNDPQGLNRGCPTQADLTAGPDSKHRIIRIPMKYRGQLPTIRPEDVILEKGDIVTVRSRQPEFFYTGGLLPSFEHPLPSDYDLPVVQAVLKTAGPVINGGLNSSNLNGAIVGTGLGNPSPSLIAILRKTPNGGQVTIRVDLNEALRDPRENILVEAGDILLLQETPEESVARYLTQTIQANFFVRWLDRQDAQGSASIIAP
jgi:protein involved in polysaccharide export with SLBB domain